MKICNLNYLKSVSPNNPQFITEMIQLFLKNVPLAMKAIDTGIKESDWETVQFHAHKLRSHIDTMGMDKKYTEMAKQIEDYASKKQNINQISDLITKLNLIFDKAYIELEAELSK